MISHQHKCIFIHISKCAGTTVEAAFCPEGLYPWKPDYEFLYGWCPQRRIFLQHATPRQLLETGLIKREIWDSYYKFIIVRNPWERTHSDYLWVMLDIKTYGTFTDFLRTEGKLGAAIMEPTLRYRGDHLTRQVDYLSLDGIPINYNRIVRFEALRSGLDEVARDLALPTEVFRDHRLKRSKSLGHYSHFYSNSRRALVDQKYGADASFLGYQFEDRRTRFGKLKALTPVLANLGLRRYIKFRFPDIYTYLNSVRAAPGALNQRPTDIL